jgi:hypothetical protein
MPGLLLHGRNERAVKRFMEFTKEITEKEDRLKICLI